MIIWYKPGLFLRLYYIIRYMYFYNVMWYVFLTDDAAFFLNLLICIVLEASRHISHYIYLYLGRYLKNNNNFNVCGKIQLENSRFRMKCNSVLSKPKSSSFQISSSVSNIYIVFPCQQQGHAIIKQK